MKRMVNNAVELEKYLFISGNFGFQDGQVIENVLENQLYSKIYLALKESYNTRIGRGLIIYDDGGQGLLVGNIDAFYSATVYAFAPGNRIAEVSFQAGDNQLTISIKQTYVATTKAIPHLYQHNLQLTTSAGNCYFVSYSASDKVATNQSTLMLAVN